LKSVGAYEAKTRLSALLEEVRRGERYAITKHGTTVALLIPAEQSRDASATVEQLRNLRKGKRLGKTSIRDLIEQGRRRW
jgi:prevent-host-death family protein